MTKAKMCAAPFAGVARRVGAGGGGGAAAPAQPVPAAAAQAAAPVAGPVPAPMVQPLVIGRQAIGAALRSLVDSQKLSGASALIYQGNGEVYFGAFGLADRESNKPMA